MVAFLVAFLPIAFRASISSVADVRDVGMTKGAEGLVAPDGRVVVESPAEFDTFSLRVSANSRSTLMLGLGLHGENFQMDE